VLVSLVAFWYSIFLFVKKISAEQFCHLLTANLHCMKLKGCRLQHSVLFRVFSINVLVLLQMVVTPGLVKRRV
jgi:hypothetical protein